ncbi:hypothetical protein ACH5RR_013239 [Cinchona calisaya]|uniref:Uncharacterized protein n=1 Tax=Cinchona calisaya TaxID=153742 RepID=A0ABD3A341_9GENT
MQQQLSQILETEQTLEARQRIFKETMGPECHGYARTIGLGPTPSQVTTDSSICYQPSDKLMSRIWSQVEELHTKKFSGIIEGMKTQIDNFNTQLESIEFGRGGSTSIACTGCGV